MNASAEPHSSKREQVEHLSPEGEILGLVDRGEMRAGNLWHRCSYVCILRTHEATGVAHSTGLVVHQRAGWKDYFPLAWDFAFGGVCDPGESARDAAERELLEEAGLSGVELVYLGSGRFDGAHSRVFGEVFAGFTNDEVVPNDGEVVAVDEIAVESIARWSLERQVSPDTMAIVLPLLGGLTQ